MSYDLPICRSQILDVIQGRVQMRWNKYYLLKVHRK